MQVCPQHVIIPPHSQPFWNYHQMQMVIPSHSFHGPKSNPAMAHKPVPKRPKVARKARLMVEKLEMSSPSPCQSSDDESVCVAVDNIIKSANDIASNPVTLESTKDEIPSGFNILRRGNLSAIVFTNGKVQTI